MNIIFATFIVMLVVGCTATTSNWRSEGPSNQKVQVKKVEYIGGKNNFRNSQIGIADPVIVNFSTAGPTERNAPLKKLPSPSLRLQDAQMSYFSPEINLKIQKAININADPTTFNHELWQTIKSKYPTLTHLAVSLFDVAETYKISEEAHHLPYMWNSLIVCRIIVIDLNTLNAVAEWRQEVADRSTWTDACSSPEELVRYLLPVGDSR